jgi:hypothetical protein
VETLALPNERFICVKGLIPPDVFSQVREFLTSEIPGSVQAVVEELGLADECALRALTVQGGVSLDRYRSLSGSSRKALTGEFRLETRLSSVLQEIPRSAQVLEAVKKMLRSDRVFMHLPPVARFVYPRNHMARVPAHRDIVYNRHLSDFLVMWVPLVPIDGSCGGVEFFPEAEGQVVDIVDLDPDKPWLSPVDVGSLRGVHPFMEPGDVLFFDKHVVHQSVGNTSDRTRLSIDFRFFGERDSSTKSFIDLETGEVTHPEAP